MKKTKEIVKKNYYLFKMDTRFLNLFALVLFLICTLIFCLIYGNDSIDILFFNLNAVIILYLPYLILHELLHSLGYVIHGADFKNITYGAHLEKGVLCCLCKQRISKRNILYSLLYPFFIIGIFTFILGIILNYPLLIILSSINISGCSGDLVMFYHLSKLNDFEFSEYNDPIAFGLYTKDDFSNLKMAGLKYIKKLPRLEKDDLRKVVISKTSIIILLIFYTMFTVTLFL